MFQVKELVTELDMADVDQWYLTYDYSVYNSSYDSHHLTVN